MDDLGVLDIVEVAALEQARDFEQPFDMFGAVLGQADRLRLFVLFVIILAELVDDLVDADIKLGLVVGGARDDERGARLVRSEEHTSELQSLMRISYAVFCLKKKKK